MAGKIKGANVADPTRASKPAQPTYRYPLEKGLGLLRPKQSPDGSQVPLTDYGRNNSGIPSSVSVKDSAALSDLDIAPPKGDPVLASLQDGGFGDRSETGAPIDDLQRKVSTDLHPVTPGTYARNTNPVQVPSKITTNEAPPVRKPGA